MKVSILDYQVGNIFSLESAFANLGYKTQVISDINGLSIDDLLVLPGVGSFSAASKAISLFRDDLRQRILDGQRCIGICLGMQLLFSSSDEGFGLGLDVIKGRVRKINSPILPQIGWNSLTAEQENYRVPTFVYYANSFCCDPDDNSSVLAWTEQGKDRFPAIVNVQQTFGFQFHPEKSSFEGIDLLSRTIKSLL